MRLNDIDLLELVPRFMQEDNTVIGLSKSANFILTELITQIKHINFVDNITALNEMDLDYIAKVSGITWYQDTFDYDKKCAIVENALKMFYVLGTRQSIQNVLDDIFDGGEIEEWHEYSGNPNHFRIKAINSSTANQKSKILLNIINTVKRKSAVLDKMEITVPGTANRYHSIVSKESDKVLRTVKVPIYNISVISKETERAKEE